MNTLYIDCSSGISGDMALGAFISLGVDENMLQDELSKLGLCGVYISAREKNVLGINAKDVTVNIPKTNMDNMNPYDAKARSYKEIKKMILTSTLSAKAKKLSKKIFDIKANAEAKAHSVSVDDVQFHEAGAVDSIIDIVGSAICYSMLDVERVIASKVPTGYGTIKCRCGELSIPAPAVREIITKHNIPHYKSNVKTELMTPTGASLITAFVDEFRDEIDMPQNCRFGYGTGKRETGLGPLKFGMAVS